MAEKNISEYGGKILNILNKAVESGDFSNLSVDVKVFINEVAKGGYKSSGNTNSEKYAYKHKNYFSGNNLGSEISDSLQSGLKYVVSSLKNEQDSHFVLSKINKYSAGLSSILKIIFGFIIDFISGAVLCDYLASFSDGQIQKELGLFIFFVAVFVGGIVMIRSGRKKRVLVKDYFQFGDIIGNRTYVTVQELSDRTARSPEYIISQINKMKNCGWLPYAMLDKAETTLMLTDEVYKEYLRSSMNTESKKKKVSEKKNVSVEEETPKNDYYTIDPNLPDEVKEILADGIDYLHKIRYFNDLIPDTETMSDKLYTLEATVLAIFKRLKEKTDMARDLRKFMSYYLPTTEKLLQSYVDLRKESLSVENIKKSQKEIEQATDIINDAFVNLLNQIFESTSWDISSDISVMKTMMKQDALL